MFKNLSLIILSLFGLTVNCFDTLSAQSENGISPTEIILGQSCALDGPAQELGIGMQTGLQAYFQMVNEKGGIHGRKIKLISKDDGYEPNLAIKNTRELIEIEKVFLLIGEVGTPTSLAVVPIAEQANIPFVGPFTGAEFLRNPYKRLVVNIRGSYYQEMEKLAEYLVDSKKMTRIACFYQNDGYGQAGLSGLEKALERRQMKLVASATYERNTLAVKSGLLKIRDAKPEAVVMVGAYKPCAEFIKLAKRIGMTQTVYCNISFVGSDALKNELGPQSEDCIISQVVRLPSDTSIPLIQEYQENMKKYGFENKIGFVSLEGYLVGKFFCEVIQSIQGDITREKFIQEVQREKGFELGGIFLHFGTEDNQGSDEIFLTIIKSNQFQTLEFTK